MDRCSASFQGEVVKTGVEGRGIRHIYAAETETVLDGEDMEFQLWLYGLGGDDHAKIVELKGTASEAVSLRVEDDTIFIEGLRGTGELRIREGILDEGTPISVENGTYPLDAG